MDPRSPCRAQVLATSFAASLATAAGHAAPPVYEAEFLGPGIGAMAINDSGVAVGDILEQTSRAWVAASGTGLILLPLPDGGVSSRATDINEAGEITGVVSAYSDPYYGASEAVLWTPDGDGGYTVERLGMRAGDVASWATALNDRGDIVGYSSDSTFRRPVLFTRAEGVVDLSATGIFDPQDVNDRRVVVDRSFTAKRLYLDTMVVEDLGVPPGSYLATAGVAINELDQVAGVAILTTGTNCDRVAARYTNGIGWEVLSGCGSSNGASDLNDRGDVVMRLNIAPWVWIDGEGAFTIESLIQQNDGYWYVINAGPASNNLGQLAIWAHNPELGLAGTVLLTPLNVPGSAELIDLRMITGAVVSGGLSELIESDDVSLHTRSGYGATFIDLHHMELELAARTTATNPGTIDLAIESRISRAVGQARVRVWNWTTSAFDLIGVYPLQQTDSTQVFPALNADHYVGPNGEITARIKHIVVSPVFAFTFDSFIDLIDLRVE